jgi:hypothetical protein
MSSLRWENEQSTSERYRHDMNLMDDNDHLVAYAGPRDGRFVAYIRTPSEDSEYFDTMQEAMDHIYVYFVTLRLEQS